MLIWKQGEDMQRANFMISEIMGYEEEQMFITGLLVLCDLKDFTLSHFTQMSISTFKKLMQFYEVQRCL